MNKPSLEQLIQRAHSAMVAHTGQDNPAVTAIAAAIAGASFGQYAYQDYLFEQLNPETAVEEWLYIWSNRFNIERVSATAANGTITFNQVAGVVSVAEGVILKTEDNKEFKVTVTTNSDQPVPVESLGLGSEQNLAVGTELFLVTAVTGLNPDTITGNGFTGGTDIEDLEHWRDRIIAAFNQRQAVGTKQDYQLWSKAAHPDIDFAWILDNDPEVGKVKVYIGQRENDPIVSEGTRQTVQDYLDSQRIAGCHVYALIPIAKAINVTISGVTDPQIQSQIEIALQDLFKTKMGTREDITPSEIMLAITPITSSFGLTTPNDVQTLANNEIFTLGSVSWN